MPDPLPDEHHHRGLLPTFGDTFEAHRLAFQLGVDIIAWAIGIVAGIVLRYEFTLDPDEWGPFSAGTVLAAIAVLDGLPPSEAVGWVRQRYHPRAVETPWQRWWLRGVR
jgi:hypothetical protein